MQILPKILFRVELNTQELKLIRRALTQHGGNAQVLCDKITMQIQKGRTELVAAIEAAISVEQVVDSNLRKDEP